MDIVDFCLLIEQDDFYIKDENELNQAIEFCNILQKTQGNYARLYNYLTAIKNNGDIIYPIII